MGNAGPAGATPLATTGGTQRRRGDGTGAASPPAKRPPPRPDYVEPPAEDVSHQNLVMIVARLQARYSQDIGWFNEMAAALTDHAEKLDVMTGYHLHDPH